MKKQNDILNSKKLSDSEYKAVLLNLLKAFCNYCDSNGLKYWIGYGTLLGAVRHKGFIPWDDDIDVLMPYDDYCRFISLNPDYLFNIHSRKLNNNYPHYFAKLSDKSTLLESEYMRDIDDMGVFIDIFPIFEVKIIGENVVKTKKRIKRLLSLLEMTAMKKLWPSNNLFKNIIKRVLYFYANILGNQFLFEKYKKLISKLMKSTKGKSFFLYAWSAVDQHFYEMTTKLDFENLKLNAPFYYKEVLELEYGNYMQLPPVDKRNSIHDFVVFSKEK